MVVCSATAWFGGAAAVGSLILFVLGWRGRRVDDHPHCRRCGFDLFGKPTGSAVCAECGADLNRHRAVRIGRRAKRLGWLTVSLLIWLLLTGVCWTHLSGVQWNHHVPLWWVMRRMESTDPGVRNTALSELAWRIGAGVMPPDRETALVDRALAYQADLDRPWVAGWGLIVEASRQVHHITDDRWNLYLLNSVTLHLVPNQKTVRLSDELSFSVVRGPDRLGWSPLVTTEYLSVGIYASPRMEFSGVPATTEIVDNSSLDLHIDHEIPPADGYVQGDWQLKPYPAADTHPCIQADFSRSYEHSSNKYDEDVKWDPAIAAALRPGPQSAVLTLMVRPLSLPYEINHRWQPPRGVQTDRVLRVTAKWTFATPPAFNHGVSYKSSVEASLSCAGVHVVETSPSYGAPQYKLICEVTCENSPIPLSFAAEVYLKGKGRRESMFDYIRFERGCPRTSRSVESVSFASRFMNVEENLDTDTVDVILKPKPDDAPTRVARVWAEEVVLKDIPVIRTKKPSR
jgi:ribosomal protein L37E